MHTRTSTQVQKKKHTGNKKVKSLLYQALLTAKSEEECAELLADLLTPEELDRICNRFQAMILLLDGQKQRQIAKRIGSSVAIVSRANRVLKSEARGIKRALNRLQKSF